MSAGAQLQLALVLPLRSIAKLILKNKYIYIYIEKNNALVPTVSFALVRSAFLLLLRQDGF